MSPEFHEIEAQILSDIDALSREAHVVYKELVLPGWGSKDRHGFPRTLYGFVMNAMSFVDRLSCYFTGNAHGEQTKRMRTLLMAAGYAPHSAGVAVQMWRHTLMHTGSPYAIRNSQTGVTYRWLLHWGEHLPRNQHMTLAEASSTEQVLNMGALYLIDDLASFTRELFSKWRGDSSKEGLVVEVNRQVLERQRVSLG